MNHSAFSQHSALSQYKSVNTQAMVDSASPHRLIQMLMEGALQHMAEAKGSIQRNSLADKGESLSRAISIIGGLRDALNEEVQSDIPKNLDDLYAYMSQRLIESNRDNSTTALEEVMDLMKTVKQGWDAIAEEVA